MVEPHEVTVTRRRGSCTTREVMSNLLGDRAGLSVEMAIRVEKAFDVHADTLMWMRAGCDLARARAREGGIAVERVAASVLVS